MNTNCILQSSDGDIEFEAITRLEIKLPKAPKCMFANVNLLDFKVIKSIFCTRQMFVADPDHGLWRKNVRQIQINKVPFGGAANSIAFLTYYSI